MATQAEIDAAQKKFEAATTEFVNAVKPVVTPPPPPPPPPPAPPPPITAKPPAAGTVLAQEGGSFTVAAATRVKYGAGTTWAERDFPAGTVACNNTTFGDPLPGSAKSCISMGAATGAVNPPAPPPPPPPPAPPPAPATGGRVAAYGNAKAYFTSDQYRLRVSEKAQFQAMLDKYMKVRVDGDDYSSGPEITLKPGQEIFGIPRNSRLPKIKVANGCTKATVKGVMCDIEFLGGSAVTSDVALGMIGGDVKSNGAKLENLTLASIAGVVDFIAGATGWHRNIRYFRARTHGSGFNGDFPHFRLSGAPGQRTSWGCVLVGTNSLDTRYAGIVVTDQEDFTVVGADFEDYPPWNHRGTGAIHIRNVGHLNLIAIGGQLNGVADCIDTGADFTNIICSTLGTSSSKTTLRLSPTAKAIAMWDVNLGSGIQNQAGNVLQISGPGALSGGNVALATELVANDLGTSRAWGFPDLSHPVENPAGDDWQTNLASKPDDSAKVQAMFNANKINEMEGRVYYFDTPVKIKGWQVAVGVAGKTAFVSKKAGMDCFETGMGSGSQGMCLIDVVLQGGALRQHESDLQLTDFDLVNVTFRDIKSGFGAGFGLEQSFCWDNGWMEHCTFYRCGAGLKSRAGQPAQVWGYIDKTNLMRPRFIECDLGLDLVADRPDNQNVFMEALFERCTNGAANLRGGHNFPLYVNSMFNLCGGDTMCASDQLAFYVGCGWKAAPGTKFFVSPNSVVEGGTFDANGTAAKVFAPGGGTRAQLHNTQTSVPIGDVRVSVNSSGAKAITVGGQTVLDAPLKPGTRFLRDH